MRDHVLGWRYGDPAANGTVEHDACARSRGRAGKQQRRDPQKATHPVRIGTREGSGRPSNEGRLRPQLARERPAADNPLRVAGDPFAQAAVRRHDPHRRRELPDLVGNPVVCSLSPFPDDLNLVAVLTSPLTGELFELRAGDVRPDGTPDVLGIDENSRHRL